MPFDRPLLEAGIALLESWSEGSLIDPGFDSTIHFNQGKEINPLDLLFILSQETPKLILIHCTNRNSQEISLKLHLKFSLEYIRIM